MSGESRKIVRAQLERDIDNALISVRVAKASAGRLADSVNTTAMQLAEIEAALRALEKVDRSGQAAADRVALFRRIERIRELINMAELGAFSVEVNRKLTAAWERVNV